MDVGTWEGPGPTPGLRWAGSSLPLRTTSWCWPGRGKACTHSWVFRNVVRPHWETLNWGPLLGSRIQFCLQTLGNFHQGSECCSDSPCQGLTRQREGTLEFWGLEQRAPLPRSASVCPSPHPGRGKPVTKVRSVVLSAGVCAGGEAKRCAMRSG